MRKCWTWGFSFGSLASRLADLLERVRRMISATPTNVSRLKPFYQRCVLGSLHCASVLVPLLRVLKIHSCATRTFSYPPAETVWPPAVLAWSRIDRLIQRGLRSYACGTFDFGHSGAFPIVKAAREVQSSIPAAQTALLAVPREELLRAVRTSVVRR